MNVFTREEAQYIASVAEALIMMSEDNVFSGWTGDAHISAETIINLAELLYDREIDMYEIVEYFERYDSLDDVFSYDVNDDDDDYSGVVVS
jgi:hypothetical protein